MVMDVEPSNLLKTKAFEDREQFTAGTLSMGPVFAHRTLDITRAQTLHQRKVLLGGVHGFGP
jgi:hypothetical protein